MICDKTTYDSYHLAQSACSHIRAKRGMKVYKCNECGKFHITSIKTNKKTFKINEKYKTDYSKVKLIKEKKAIVNPMKIKRNSIELTTYRPFAYMTKNLIK